MFVSKQGCPAPSNVLVFEQLSSISGLWLSQVATPRRCQRSVFYRNSQVGNDHRDGKALAEGSSPIDFTEFFLYASFIAAHFIGTMDWTVQPVVSRQRSFALSREPVSCLCRILTPLAIPPYPHSPDRAPPPLEAAISSLTTPLTYHRPFRDVRFSQVSRSPYSSTLPILPEGCCLTSCQPNQSPPGRLEGEPGGPNESRVCNPHPRPGNKGLSWWEYGGTAALPVQSATVCPSKV